MNPTDRVSLTRVNFTTRKVAKVTEVTLTERLALFADIIKVYTCSSLDTLEGRGEP